MDFDNNLNKKHVAIRIKEADWEYLKTNYPKYQRLIQDIVSQWIQNDKKEKLKYYYLEGRGYVPEDRLIINGNIITVKEEFK